jgi:hypothetical protein
MTDCHSAILNQAGDGGGAFFLGNGRVEDISYLLIENCDSTGPRGAFSQGASATGNSVVNGFVRSVWVNIPSGKYAIWCDAIQMRLQECYFRNFGLGFYAEAGHTITLARCFIEATETPSNVVRVDDGDGRPCVVDPNAAVGGITGVCTDVRVWNNAQLNCLLVSYCNGGILGPRTRSPLPPRTPIGGGPTLTPVAATVPGGLPPRTAIGGGSVGVPSRTAFPPRTAPATGPAQTYDQGGGSSKGGNTGVIVGAIVGVVVALAIAALLLWLFVFKKDGDEGSEGMPETTGTAGNAATPSYESPAASPTPAAAGAYGDEDF